MSVLVQRMVPATLEDLYTVPREMASQELAVYLCNRSPGLWDRQGSILSVAIGRGGAPDAPEQYLYHEYAMAHCSTLYCELTLDAGDVVRVSASSENVACTIMELKSTPRQGGPPSAVTEETRKEAVEVPRRRR